MPGNRRDLAFANLAGRIRWETSPPPINKADPLNPDRPFFLLRPSSQSRTLFLLFYNALPA